MKPVAQAPCRRSIANVMRSCRESRVPDRCSDAATLNSVSRACMRFSRYRVATESCTGMCLRKVASARASREMRALPLSLRASASNEATSGMLRERDRSAFFRRACRDSSPYMLSRPAASSSASLRNCGDRSVRAATQLRTRPALPEFGLE